MVWDFLAFSDKCIIESWLTLLLQANDGFQTDLPLVGGE